VRRVQPVLARDEAPVQRNQRAEVARPQMATDVYVFAHASIRPAGSAIRWGSGSGGQAVVGGHGPIMGPQTGRAKMLL
jgi:hypothetical protein